MKTLGISAYYHDSAAAIVIDGEIIACAQEEWFTRTKHDATFPHEAIKWCLEYAGLTINDLDAIAFYDKPFLKFERLLSTYYSHAPTGVGSFIRSMPIWIKEKLFLKSKIRKELKRLYPDTTIPKLLFPEHHLSHAASAYYPSPFEETAVLTIDGVGEWATATISHAKEGRIEVLKELRYPHSLGLLYSAFTYFLGFRVNFGEYKLMGLAPYGNPEDSQTHDFIQKIKKELIEVFDDGSIWLNQRYFRYSHSNRMIHEQRWSKLFGINRRKPESNFDQTHSNLALAIQKVTEDIVLKMTAEAKRLTGSNNLCLAGGVALNCVANGKIERSGIFDHIWIQPASGDAGGSMGAALASEYIYHETPFASPGKPDGMKGAFLGPEFGDFDILRAVKKYKAVFHKRTDDELMEQISDALANGLVVGWYQGRQEFGPRALGNRSILGDPRSPEMQRTINLKIKFRESFRPFAPSVLDTDCESFIDLSTTSPYMLLVAPVQERIRKPLPPEYHQLTLSEKLAISRSDLPAITHVDYSARVQTVHRDTNPKYYSLLEAFKEKTGLGALINTSFNVRGEPVVCSPEDAFRCFMKTNMDVLVLRNFVFLKEEQPSNSQTADIRNEKFELD